MTKFCKQTGYGAQLTRVLCALSLFAISTNVYAKEETTGVARITAAQAQTIALNARPGKVTDEELEEEKGGSGLRYSFDIKSGAKTYEVGVDATTGKLLENAPEGLQPD